jgi:hypothetical protein
MVAERAPAAAASRITCTAKRAGTSTSTWSGFSGRLAKSL